MKKFLQILFVTVLLTSCSTDDDPSKKVEFHNITFSVSSTDNNRLSQILFEIKNSEENVYHSSYSNVHLPLTRNFVNHKITEFSFLEITYIDNSGGGVGETFEPYSVTLLIKVGAEIKAEKVFTVTESGHVDFVAYDLD